jgi:serine/threonine protein kinase
MSERSEQIDVILSAAVELTTRDDRANFIRKACAGDDELQRQVEELVEAYLSAGDFLESPAPGLPPTIDLGIEESAGTSIGRYKLLQQIGEGGFAVVFMAEQEQPVRRRVAVKVIKPGMDSRQVIARFGAERQALALMDHSNIARVFDAGTTESGRPYFVMELVKGKPITDYCDEHCLSIDERLALFSQVCDAVQHAHQKGVIHRDIKPSNVLVRTEDDKPAVKVIDFGIAKATETRLTDMTLFTDFRQLIGTPAYMSPEQADGSLDIDTRTDVYSLGVLLYELLSGSPPFDPGELKSRAIAEMQRIIREVDPPAPSARLSTLDADTRVLKAKARGVEPGRLTQRLRGELDWIALRALEKDRNRRYGSAVALADDLERYLTNQPVEARPATLPYRFRKFAGRNKGLLTALGAVGIVLIGATILSTWQAIRAARAEQQALADSRRAEAISEFLVQAFRSPDPDRDGRTVTIAEVLDRAVEEVRDKYREDPLLRAALLDSLAKTYVSLGLSSKAAPLAEEALRIRTSELGSNANETLSTMATLSLAYSWTGRHSEAIKLAEKELSGRRAAAPDSVETAWALHRLAMWLRQTGDGEDAVPLALEAVEIFKKNLGPTHRDTLNAMHMAAIACDIAQRSNPEFPSPYTLDDILEACEKNLGEDDAFKLLVMDSAASENFYEGRFDVAEELLKRSLELKLKRFGPMHGYTLQSFKLLAELYARPDLDAPQSTLAKIDALLATAPDIQELKSARIAALRQIRPIGQSADLIAEMIRDAADQKWTQSPRKLLCRELAKNSEVFDAVAALMPDETTLWIGRGQHEIELNEIAKAETSYAKVINQRPLQDEHYEYACLLLLRDDKARYQEFCRETLHRRGEPKDGYEAYIAARLYGLGPADCVRTEQLVGWAENAARDRRAWQLQALAIAHLRAGKYREAIAAYQTTIPAQNSLGADHGESWFGLAIAHHKRGNEVEARRCLAQGRTALQRARPKFVGKQANVGPPSHWLLLNVMAREAEGLLNSPAPTDSPELTAADE